MTETHNIYKLQRNDTVEYDEMARCVVIAESVDQARELAAKEAAVEGPDKWLSSRVWVDYLGIAAAGQLARVVVTDVIEG